MLYFAPRGLFFSLSISSQYSASVCQPAAVVIIILYKTRIKCGAECVCIRRERGGQQYVVVPSVAREKKQKEIEEKLLLCSCYLISKSSANFYTHSLQRQQQHKASNQKRASGVSVCVWEWWVCVCVRVWHQSWGRQLRSRRDDDSLLLLLLVRRQQISEL